MDNVNAHPDPSHPYISQLERIRHRNVVVIDDVAAPPVVGMPYITDNCLILICRQGAVLNDENEDLSLHHGDFSILLPDQVSLQHRVTGDFRATIVALSRQFFEQIRLRYPYMRRTSLFRRRPSCRLSSSQFDSALHLIDSVRDISRSDSPFRSEMLVHLLCVLFNVLTEFHIDNYPDEQVGKEGLFSRFYELLIQHYRSSHEVAYYAALLGMSTRRLSSLIRRETGLRAADWISNYVLIQAQTLIRSRNDMTMQQIAFQLGFGEASSFCRFFRKRTGMTPMDCRMSAVTKRS